MSDAPFYCSIAVCWCDRIECDFDPLTGKGCSMKRLKKEGETSMKVIFCPYLSELKECPCEYELQCLNEFRHLKKKEAQPKKIDVVEEMDRIERREAK